jgi:hypothetical protein
MATTPKKPTPAAAKKAKDQTKMNPKTTKPAVKFSGKLNQANPGKATSVGTIAKKVVMALPPVATAAAGVKARLASVKKNEKLKMDTAKNSKTKAGKK